MSQLLIQQYLNDISRLRKFSGVVNEQVIREAFKDLLKSKARAANLHFIPELEYQTALKTRVVPDGTVLHDLRVPLGYWEAKDTADDLDEEIRKKFLRGYPQDNIIFENSDTAVLVQDRREVMRCDMDDTDRLLQLVELFFSYERQEIREFRRAVQQFRQDLPAVLEALRGKIEDAYASNRSFQDAARKFLRHAQETINPAVEEADVREMLIQHILTEEIFTHVFNEGQFHRENNIAQQLYALEEKFFTGGVKRDALRALDPYYATIRSNAALISSHAEKQTFLKVIYENFYKVYNPKAADRLGVVYTPNEIVKFMIEGADWLCQKHFGKSLIDRHVEILDPAAGTGTYICELLEHFRGQPHKLAYKYKQELHANEVAILPYYVANLNIEATYAAISGQFAEFPNLCFVDTLDNVAGLGIRAGYQHDMFAGLSEENVARVKRQNARKISVIVGNPPYNANQRNENDDNKNREYPRVDELIRSSYIRLSTAQKTKVYDMYARFFRWASDRMADDGVLALITNRSFVDTRTFDGFRRAVEQEFSEIHILDLGGDWKRSDAAGGGNVFGIGTGVAISFMVKQSRGRGCKIHYANTGPRDTAEDKLAFVGNSRLADVRFQRVEPDRNANWINLPQEAWENLIPIAEKVTKAAKSSRQDRAIFRMYSLGVSTNRDEWLYASDRDNLLPKVVFLKSAYDQQNGGSFDDRIKWSETLKRRRRSNRKERLNPALCRSVLYRPFVERILYTSPLFVDRPGALFGAFPPDAVNVAITFSDIASRASFCVLSTKKPIDLHFGASSDGYQYLPRYRYNASGERIDNITGWALKKFREAYRTASGMDAITTDDIFHYVYAVLHDPEYREKYALNLKREFPRIPFYPDFWRWAEWGEQLMALHTGYEQVEPWPLERLDAPDPRARAAGVSPRALLNADRDNGVIRLDTETQLSGIPADAWCYRLGNRSGLDWILDQYKEKTPKDPTIRERFNTYSFADHKEKVIDLLMRVTRVSVETVAITKAMKTAKR